MNKSEIYVEITNEQQRLRAIEILEKAGERTWDYSRSMEINIDCRYLVYCEDGDWLISPRKKNHKITLYELDEMLMPKNEMKKQTSVEWLVDYLTNIKELPFIRQNLNMNEQNILNDIIKQAKEMERQQIIDAHSDWVRLTKNLPTRTAEQYYTETFNP